MKFSLLLALTLLSSFAFAGEKYICTQTNGDEYAPKKIILTQVGDKKVVEGELFPFTLEIYQGNMSKPATKEIIFVLTEDVMFKFNNKAKKINGIIFMDEPNESWVTVGKEDIRMDCK